MGQTDNEGSTYSSPKIESLEGLRTAKRMGQELTKALVVIGTAAASYLTFGAFPVVSTLCGATSIGTLFSPPETFISTQFQIEAGGGGPVVVRSRELERILPQNETVMLYDVRNREHTRALPLSSIPSLVLDEDTGKTYTVKKSPTPPQFNNVDIVRMWSDSRQVPSSLTGLPTIPPINNFNDLTDYMKRRDSLTKWMERANFREAETSRFNLFGPPTEEASTLTKLGDYAAGVVVKKLFPKTLGLAHRVHSEFREYGKEPPGKYPPGASGRIESVGARLATSFIVGRVPALGLFLD
jgi:hypothetical protein